MLPQTGQYKCIWLFSTFSKMQQRERDLILGFFKKSTTQCGRKQADRFVHPCHREQGEYLIKTESLRIPPSSMAVQRLGKKITHSFGEFLILAVLQCLRSRTKREKSKYVPSEGIKLPANAMPVFSLISNGAPS